MENEAIQETACETRMAVSYCQRCGALRLHPEGEEDTACLPCRRRASKAVLEAYR
jgi:hypothetical protein